MVGSRGQGNEGARHGCPNNGRKRHTGTGGSGDLRAGRAGVGGVDGGSGVCVSAFRNLAS